jgi:hypothetical protein
LAHGDGVAGRAFANRSLAHAETNIIDNQELQMSEHTGPLTPAEMEICDGIAKLLRDNKVQELRGMFMLGALSKGLIDSQIAAGVAPQDAVGAYVAQFMGGLGGVMMMMGGETGVGEGFDAAPSLSRGGRLLQ